MKHNACRALKNTYFLMESSIYPPVWWGEEKSHVGKSHFSFLKQ